jgi:hypothetical protein
MRKLESFWGLQHRTGCGERLAWPADASAQTRRRAGRRQGLKILAREVNIIAALRMPKSQAKWLWDCTTPQTALAGILVSAGALRFAHKTAVAKSFLPQLGEICTHPALKGHGFEPCRSRVRIDPLSGAEGHFPQRLKPGAVKRIYGTPEGAPLQSGRAETAMAIGETAILPVSHAHDR